MKRRIISKYPPSVNRSVRLILVSIALLPTGLLSTSPSASAEVPHLIRYQGTAVDSNGVPLEGPYILTFRLYDADTDGTVLWEEEQADVLVTAGHFSVMLGQVTPLTVMDWNEPCWLSIQINSEPELSPRQRITSVPLAVRAEVAQVAEELANPITTSTILDDANTLVPQGAVILWTGATCPEGYTALTAYNDKFLVASDTAGNTGGSNTHTHQAGSYYGPGHTHTVSSKGWGLPGTNNTSSPPGWIRLMNAGNWGSATDGSLDTNKATSTAGTGGVSGTSASTDSRPAFRTILLCQKD